MSKIMDSGHKASPYFQRMILVAFRRAEKTDRCAPDREAAPKDALAGL
jgi:hypothetical protein